MQAPDHRKRQWTGSVQNLVHPIRTSDHRLQVFWRQAFLFHPELDCINRVGQRHGEVPDCWRSPKMGSIQGNRSPQRKKLGAIAMTGWNTHAPALVHQQNSERFCARAGAVPQRPRKAWGGRYHRNLQSPSGIFIFIKNYVDVPLRVAIYWHRSKRCTMLIGNHRPRCI